MNKQEILNGLLTITKEKHNACKTDAASVDKNHPTERGALQLKSGIYNVAIAAGLIRYSKANGITELDRLQSDTGELFISKNAVLNDSCITFIYNPYEIASYATGRIEVDITYEELKHILK